MQHCFIATGLVAALRHYCCPSYPFSNLLSDEPPPVKLPPETDLSESMAAEKEAGAEPSSAKAGKRTKAAEADKRSATLKSRRERRSSKSPSPASLTQTPPPEPEPVK